MQEKKNAPAGGANEGYAIVAPAKCYVSIYSNCRTPKPTKAGLVDVDEWLDVLATKRTHRYEKDGRAWAPHKLTSPDATRSNAAVEVVSLAALDFDDGVEFPRREAQFVGLKFAAHTSHSHTPAHPKYRVVVPFGRPVPAGEWRFLAPALAERFPGHDRSCVDPARLFYLPSAPPDAEGHWAVRRDGELLDPAPLIARGRELLREPSAQALNADLIAHVAALPPTTDADAEAIRAECPQVREMAESGGRVGYEHWRGTAGILKHCRDGAKLFHEWSSGHPTYSAEETQAKFDSWQAGPTTCRHFDNANPGGCEGCEYRGKFKSPITLGIRGTPAPVPEDQGQQDAPGDIANGRMFASAAKGHFIYNTTLRAWMQFRNGVWRLCERGEEVHAAKKVAARALQRATDMLRDRGGDDPAVKRMMASALRLQKEHALHAMLRLATSEPEMSKAATDFEADPCKLNCLNGVVDLNTGFLLAHDPAMLCSRQVQAGYRRDAECPRWEQFLSDVFGDSATVESLQRFVGYSATGLVSEEKFVFAFGHGANGKSVFANVLRSVFGTYCATAPASMLEVQTNTGGPRDDIARTAGARLIFANETNEGRAWDSQAIKTLVSTEVVSARYLYGSYFEFQPTAKIIVRGNHKPRVQDTGDGMWRRIDLWPFERQFAEEERNPRLSDELIQERDGILRWIVDGCLMWQRDGLKQSPRIRAASAAYRKECDLVHQWLDERCTLSADARHERTALYSSFRQWTTECGLHPPSSQKFNRAMEERGFRVVASNGQRFLVGLRLGK